MNPINVIPATVFTLVCLVYLIGVPFMIAIVPWLLGRDFTPWAFGLTLGWLTLMGFASIPDLRSWFVSKKVRP